MREFAAAGLPELGVLYVAPPLARIRGTLRRLLFGSGLPLDDPVEEVLAIEVTPEGSRHLSKLLLGGLSEAELRERRAVLVEKCSGFGLVSPGGMFEAACRAGVHFTSTGTRVKGHKRGFRSPPRIQRSYQLQSYLDLRPHIVPEEHDGRAREVRPLT